ncbi:DeoR/GlpR family DNA-binding transcription regulator [Streptomyces marincola]|uniref:DeoR/GlpR family DNA-binding transcription regulator n=1 Tax=Streptomyces marincola TaxID=2878388 RepID=UPI001CF431C0|nr:DeoR/GlpR family DNA-binding transcription regulator [Streptomyces marincola]UCM86552.1 DeoR/GlpR family DNA-binding transcription regulator [Streptomyces marincola]
MPQDPLKYRAAPARRDEILDALRETGFLSIAEVAARLGVSEMTARRDIRRLAADAEVLAVRGGVVLPAGPRDRSAPAYSSRSAADVEEKRTVGRVAATCVRDDDVIAVDAGTTAYQLAAALPDSFHGTVVTHSVPVIDLLMDRPSARGIALGGDLFAPSRALVGSLTVDTAKRLKVRTFYLGAAGVDERGIYAAADVERQVKETLMDIAERVVLLIGRRKFTTTAPVLLCGWDRLDAVVTDVEPPPPVHRTLEGNGVRLVLPTTEPATLRPPPAP